MSRGITNNNPGNIRYSKSNNWLNQTGQDSDGFTQFKTADDGLRAMYKLVNNYQGKGLNTVQDIISRYAPTSENDTAKYIKNVSQKMGVDPNKQLQTSDLNSLVSAMVFHENGSQPYNPEQYSNAQAMSQSSIDNNQQTFSNQFNTGAVPSVPSTAGTSDMPSNLINRQINYYPEGSIKNKFSSMFGGDGKVLRAPKKGVTNPMPNFWSGTGKVAGVKDIFNPEALPQFSFSQQFPSSPQAQMSTNYSPTLPNNDLNNMSAEQINESLLGMNTNASNVQPGALTNMREINQSLSGMNTNGQDLNSIAAIQDANFGGLGANGGMPEGGFIDIKAMADPAKFDATKGITALNGVGDSLDVNKVIDPIASDTGMFSQNSMFGGVDKDGVKTNGWLSSGTKAFADIAGAYASIKGLGLAKDTFKFNKALSTTNLNNQVQTVNNRIGDQAAARRSAYTSSAFDQSVADKAVAKKGVKGLGG